ALNGHTEPYASIKKTELYELGFDDDRIRWLSQPHIPTSVIEDITWNHDKAHQILAIFCNKIDGEELWRFAPAVTGSKMIEQADLTDLCALEALPRIKKVLEDYWSNRTLIEIAKNKYVPLWTYGQSTSWGSLNEKEKASLTECFEELNKKNEKLWKKQADEIFEAITKAVKMIPCGEDLGVNIECVPKTMDAHKILGLRVVRWCREWSKEGQPYVPFADYTPLSVTTTSVHDSSTLRQWWDDEKESVKAFLKENAENFGDENKTEESANSPFTPEIAEKVLQASSTSASQWFIPPLQDFLYMDKSLWLDNSADERINVPGTVTNFNWTYRLPCTLEDLCKNQELINKIKKISSR
ncbi:MAG: 4-alpha-glucanotransferase, partial [Treponema sp.]|nr:4-alpha-glucanotransferase [Treponema sp.]